MPEDRDRQNVLVRITENPQLARAVPLLRPEVLHAVIARYGLQDCGDLVALATPQQLRAVFDLDLWKAPRAGASEQFDPARFCEWLEVLVDAGPAIAADRLAQQDVALVVAGLAPNVRVLDPGVFEPIEERSGAEAVLNPGRERGVHAEIGGYVVVARRTEAWDGIIDVLAALEEHHTDVFHRVMRGCRKLSNSGRELDGLDNLLDEGAQVCFDLSASRELRRDRLGFLPPEQARAFLEAARRTSLAREPPGADPVFAAYLRTVTGAQFEEPSVEGDSSGDGDRQSAASSADVAEVIEVLTSAGVIADARLALPPGVETAAPINAALHTYLEHQADDGWMAREQALGFLANALVAGSSVQSRAFSQREAADAVAATCNLGLEYWTAGWPDSSTCDLVAIFRVGWAVLHRDVSMRVAEGVLDALDQVQIGDRDLQFGVRVLRRELHKQHEAGTPWRACERLEALAPLDLAVWAALTSLFGECPVMLANVSDGPRAHRLHPSEFQFVAHVAQIDAIRRFLASLPERLTNQRSGC